MKELDRPHCRALSVERVYGVKKGRLFERSEFLPFIRKCFRSSSVSEVLIFSLSLSFASRQKKVFQHFNQLIILRSGSHRHP